MITDTVQNVLDSACSAQLSPCGGINWWRVAAIAELVLIVWLLMFRNRKMPDAKMEAKKKVMNEGRIDFGNTFKSAFHAQELYKSLIVSCHPDKFAPDDVKMAVANELSTRITENKNNYKQLEALKKEAEVKLGIIIK